jgi:hypothetical protein
MTLSECEPVRAEDSCDSSPSDFCVPQNASPAPITISTIPAVFFGKLDLAMFNLRES